LSKLRGDDVGGIGMSELKMCSHCGGKVEIDYRGCYDCGDQAFTRCGNCGATVSFDGIGIDSDLLTEKFNTRTEPPARQLMLEEVKAMHQHPVWVQVNQHDEKYKCGVVGTRKLMKSIESGEYLLRYVINFDYGWEWVEDMCSNYAIYDRKPDPQPIKPAKRLTRAEENQL
jgi:predicted RNA-binding Zn-ribbon protein involved in translation (DUF1610 family)